MNEVWNAECGVRNAECGKPWGSRGHSPCERNAERGTSNVERRTIIIDDALWNELIKATDGAIGLCYQCGTCSASCPWSIIKNDSSYNVRKIIREAQCNIKNGEGIWLCSMCAQCEVNCPHAVPITKIIRTLRDYAFKERKAPEEFNSIFWALFWDGNPYRLPPSRRTAWTKGETLPVYDETKEFLLYFGNDYSYEQRSNRVARTLIQILKKANVNFGTLGDNETCFGSTTHEIGNIPYFKETVRENAKKLNDLKVKEVVSISPHDFDVLKNYYPNFGATFKATHILQIIKELLERGNLKLTKEINETVAYHDPCYLGRKNKIFDEPRDILNKIPGLKLVEFPHNRYDSLCCGGGGGRMWLDTEPEERFSNLRVKEASELNVNIIATSCPYCVIMFEDSSKYLKMKNLKVFDVLELVKMALE